MAERGSVCRAETEYFVRKTSAFTAILQGLRHKRQYIGNAAGEYVRRCIAEELCFDTGFLLLPFFIAAGIICYFLLPFEPDWYELSAAFALVCGLFYMLRQRYFLRYACFFAAMAAFGALCAKGETARLQTVMLQSGGFTRITARIMAIEPLHNRGMRVVAKVVATQNPQIAPQPQRLRLSLRKLPEGAKLGSGLQGLVSLRSFASAVRPGGYDFAFQNYFRAIGGQGSFVGAVELAELPMPSVLERIELRLASFRHSITKRITAALAGVGDTGAFAAALITGERAGIDPAATQALRLSGLAHILSISGLHMALVAGMVLVICRIIFGLFPIFFSYHSSQKTAAFIALFAAGFYLLLSGADISAKRSFIMVTVMLLAVMCDRAALSLRNLALSACFIMIFWPHEVMGASFQMSFAATAALIAAFGSWSVYRQARREKTARNLRLSGRAKPFYKPVSKMRHALHKRLVAPVLSTCMASPIAGAAGGLYSAYHFNNTAPYGIISNVLALPLMSVLVMPAALLGMILMPLHLETAPLQIMGIGIVGVEKIAGWVAGFSPQGNPGVIPPISLLLCTCGLILLIFLRTGLRCSGILFIVLGFAVYAATPQPLAVIAENGRFIAVFNRDNSLSINASRQSKFQLQNWQSSFAAGVAVQPQHIASAAASETDSACKDLAGLQPKSPALFNSVSENKPFVCSDFFCCAVLRQGKILAYAESRFEQERAFNAGDIVVLNTLLSDEEADAFAQRAALLHKILILQRDLALHGAAVLIEEKTLSPSIALRGDTAGAKMRLQWAVQNATRPWNAYRRFSARAQGQPA